MQIIEQLLTDNFLKETLKSNASEHIKKDWIDFFAEYEDKKKHANKTAYINNIEELRKLTSKQIEEVLYLQLVLPKKFSEKDAKIINNCVNLKAIDITNDNSYKEILINIENFKSLRILQLDGLHIKFSHIDLLINLHRFTITGTTQRNLLDNIGNLINLQYIDCSSNGLQNLPENISNLVDLQQLDCSHNKLNTLPDGLTKLTKLQKLNFNSNELKTLPYTIGDLTNLEFLRCVNNQLQILPDMIGNLQNLQGLYCGTNQLQSLPNSISNLHKLEYLDCSNNNFQKIPIPFADVPEKLSHWDLEDNPFSEMPELQTMDSGQIMKFLDENRGRKPYTTVWKMDKALQNVLHKYLIGFKNFVRHVEKEEIIWEIKEHAVGLQITVHAKLLTIKQIDDLLYLYVGDNLEVDMLTLQRKLSIQELFEIKAFLRDLEWEKQILQRELDYVVDKVTFLQDDRRRLTLEINFFQDKYTKKIEILQNLQRQLEIKPANIAPTSLNEMRQGLQKVRIFLAATTELLAEKEELMAFFQIEANKSFRNGVLLEIVDWEYDGNSISEQDTEVDYVSKLKISKVFCALFHTHVDKNTKIAFKMAYEHFKTQKQLANFYTYFKELTPETRKETADLDLLSLFKFKDRLSNEMKQEPIYFTNIDNLKYQLKSQLEMEILPRV